MRHRNLVLLTVLALLMISGTSAFIFGTNNSLAQPLRQCGPGYERSGAFCYPECKAGYSGTGPVCWENCPDGFTNDGATCRKNAHIISRESYTRGAGSALECASGEEQDGALCYPKCKAGYNGQGPVCWQKCPEGYTNDGATCRRNAKIISADTSDCPGYDLCCVWKKNRGRSKCPEGYKNDGCTCRRDVHIFAKDSYTRTAGRALSSCDSNEEKDGALCYPKCKAGYNGVGPVCWASCPEGYKNDGATCRRDVIIRAKKSYGRGVGKLLRRDYEGIFFRYMRDHHNIYSSRGQSLTEGEKVYLKKFYPARLVDGVRVVEEIASSGAFIHGADATTYGNNLIVINKRLVPRRTLKLLKHEFVHICQYDVLGIDGFAREYADGYVDAAYIYGDNPLEQDAFDYQDLPDATTPIVSAVQTLPNNRAGWRMRSILQCK